MTLPRGYTEVEYIQWNLYQYFDTGRKATQNTRLVCEVSNFPRTANMVLFGARANASSKNYCFMATGASNYRTDFHTGSVGFATSVSYSGRLIIDKNKNVTTLNGEVTATNTNGAFETPGNLYLFAMNNNGTASGFANSGATKVISYWWKRYENDVLIQDLVGAIRDSDGVVGLYDKVNDEFLEPKGSGAFTAGPAVGPTGHQTLIDAVGYEITEGYGMINAAVYQLVEGKVMVEGVVYTIGLKEKEPEIQYATVTITGNGKDSDSSKQYSYIVIDGETYISAATIEVPVGSNCECYVRGMGQNRAGKVTLNGTIVATTPNTDSDLHKIYTHTITKATTINISHDTDNYGFDWRCGVITITDK